MYQPASNATTSASLTHLATVYYNRTAEDALRTTFMFWKGVEDRILPKRNGPTVQFFRRANFGANTTPKVEGQVGTGLTMTTSNFTATISQYADFGTVSDLLDDTSISDEVAALADQLGYRGGLTADNLVKAEVDGAAASIDLPLLGSFYSAADARNARHSLQGLNIRPKSSDGYFEALIHPYVSYDLLNDPSAGGFQDIIKRPGSVSNNRLFTLEDRGYIGAVGGVRFWETTNVTQVSGTPNKWRVYYFGEGGLAAIDLAGRGPSRVMRPGKPNNERFRVNVFRPGLSVADPEGVIRGVVSYNFVFVAKLLDTTNYRIRKTDAPSSIVP